MSLLPEHIADLRASGLHDNTIAAAGIYSEIDPIRVGQLLNWNGPAYSIVPAIAFPYRQLNGDFNGLVRFKPSRPRTDEKGDPQKYEQPKNAPSKAYLTPGSLRAIGSPGETIGLTEGEKKSLCADQYGFACIGLAGVWNWQAKRLGDAAGKKTGPRLLNEYLAAIEWGGRSVWIAFDSDPRRNPSVNHAQAELARVLTEHGAIVSLVELPLGPPNRDGIPTKMGLDDFLVSHGPDAFRELLQDAVEDL